MRSRENKVFRELAWDSAHFGLKIGRVTERGSDVPDRAVRQAAASGIDCLYLLADSEDADTLRSAAAAGFRVVDIRVTLSGDIPQAIDQAGIRVAIADDLPFLTQIAQSSHRDSRFYADGRFSWVRCDALFAAWIERSCTDRSFADVVFVADVRWEACRLRYLHGKRRLGRNRPNRGRSKSARPRMGRRFAGTGALVVCQRRRLSRAGGYARIQRQSVASIRANRMANRHSSDMVSLVAPLIPTDQAL